MYKTSKRTVRMTATEAEKAADEVVNEGDAFYYFYGDLIGVAWNNGDSDEVIDVELEGTEDAFRVLDEILRDIRQKLIY